MNYAREDSEVVRLRSELVVINEKNESLKVENLHLRTQLAQFTPGPAARFPQEILLLIFNRAIPPYFMLNSSLSFGPNSLWWKTLRLKKAIVGVCHAWYDAGIAFLYEDASIRRLEQLFCILRTTKHSEGLARHIRVLNIRCFIPVNLAPEFQRGLRALLELCPRLTTFGYHQGLLLPSPFASTSPLRSSITSLHLDAALDYDPCMDMLVQVGPSLLSLHILLDFFVDDDNGPPSLVNREVLLPSLKTLALEVRSNSSDNFDIVKRLWKLPDLRGLTITHDATSGGMNAGERSVLLLVQTHGSLLQSLHLRVPTGHKQLKALLGYCPLLEQLIIFSESVPLDSWSMSFVHPKLLWLDVWRTDTRPKLTKVAKSEHAKYWGLRKTLFPALLGVRMIYGLPFASYDLLAYFPPESVQDDSESFAVDIFDHRLQHQVGFISWDCDEPSWERDVSRRKRLDMSYYSAYRSDSEDSGGSHDDSDDESDQVQYSYSRDYYRDKDDNPPSSLGSDSDYAQISDSEDSDSDEDSAPSEFGFEVGQDVVEDTDMGLLQERVRSLMDEMGV